MNERMPAPLPTSETTFDMAASNDAVAQAERVAQEAAEAAQKAAEQLQSVKDEHSRSAERMDNWQNEHNPNFEDEWNDYTKGREKRDNQYSNGDAVTNDDLFITKTSKVTGGPMDSPEDNLLVNSVGQFSDKSVAAFVSNPVDYEESLKKQKPVEEVRISPEQFSKSYAQVLAKGQDKGKEYLDSVADDMSLTEIAKTSAQVEMDGNDEAVKFIEAKLVDKTLEAAIKANNEPEIWEARVEKIKQQYKDGQAQKTPEAAPQEPDHSDQPEPDSRLSKEDALGIAEDMNKKFDEEAAAAADSDNRLSLEEALEEAEGMKEQPDEKEDEEAAANAGPQAKGGRRARAKKDGVKGDLEKRKAKRDERKSNPDKKSIGDRLGNPIPRTAARVSSFIATDKERFKESKLMKGSEKEKRIARLATGAGFIALTATLAVLKSKNPEAAYSIEEGLFGLFDGKDDSPGISGNYVRVGETMPADEAAKVYLEQIGEPINDASVSETAANIQKYIGGSSIPGNAQIPKNLNNPNG